MSKLLSAILFFVFSQISSVAYGQSNTWIIEHDHYGNIVLQQSTVIQVRETFGKELEIDTFRYVRMTAKIAGECKIIWAYKLLYRYPKQGITFMTHEDSKDTITGILFYPPSKGKTAAGLTLKRNSISELRPLKTDSVPFRYRNVRRLHGARDLLLYSENASCYLKLSGISYGFKRSRKILGRKYKNVLPQRKITEIKIGY